MPVLRHWDVFDRTDLGPDGEQAREELSMFLAVLDTQATRFVDRREENRARVAARVRQRRDPRHRLLSPGGHTSSRGCDQALTPMSGPCSGSWQAALPTLGE